MRRDEEANLVGVNADCLMKALSFLQEQMSDLELPAFVAHTESCRECQEYIEIISVLMADREKILKQLRKRLP